MFRQLNNSEMIAIHGEGKTIDAFCAGFGAVSVGYAVGVALNWWNPIGWVGAGIGLTIDAACVVNALR